MAVIVVVAVAAFVSVLLLLFSISFMLPWSVFFAGTGAAASLIVAVVSCFDDCYFCFYCTNCYFAACFMLLFC